VGSRGVQLDQDTAAAFSAPQNILPSLSYMSLSVQQHDIEGCGTAYACNTVSTFPLFIKSTESDVDTREDNVMVLVGIETVGVDTDRGGTAKV